MTIKFDQIHNGVKINNINSFQLEHIFECGQCFRWNKNEENNTYVGVAEDKVLEIVQNKDSIQILNIEVEEFEEKWSIYFDLQRDYEEIKAILSTETTLNEAIQYGNGIRLLNQDEWEVLISFIISTNNNIPRIKKIIETMSKRYGKKIIYNNRVYYSFPKPEDLIDVKLDEIMETKCGYRGKFIRDAIIKVYEGEIDLYNLKNMNLEKIKKELLKINGVGPKVADCIMLFSMGRYECYPIDVWIKKITEKYFFKSEASIENIRGFAKKNWGNYAGFAQQYLFYYARNNN